MTAAPKYKIGPNDHHLKGVKCRAECGNDATHMIPFWQPRVKKGKRGKIATVGEIAFVCPYEQCADKIRNDPAWLELKPEEDDD